MDWKKRFTGKLIVCYVLIVLFMSWARPEPWLLAVCLPLLVIGELIRIWGTGHLRKNKAVITSGPYSYIRDPLYMGTLFILTGFCVAARVYELLILVWLTFFFYYMPYKQRREGNRLSKKFGQVYDEYRSSVRSLIPRLKPYKGQDFGTPWSWSLVKENDEIGTAVSVIVFYVLLWVKALFFQTLVFPQWHLF